MTRTKSRRHMAARSILVSLLLVASVPHVLRAQQAEAVPPVETARIIVDQKARQLLYQPGGTAQPRPVPADDQVMVLSRDRRTPIPVVVEHTNSALYTCQLTQTAVRAPALDTLSQFLTKLGPYLTNALPVIATVSAVEVKAEIDTITTAAEQLRDELAQLDSRVHGDRGMGGVNRRALVALNRMRATPHGVNADATSQFGRWLQDGFPELCDGACERLELPDSVAVTLVRIDSLRQVLRNQLAQVERAETIDLEVSSLRSLISGLESQRGMAEANTGAQVSALEATIATAQKDLLGRAGVLAVDQSMRGAVEDLVARADSALKDAPKTLSAARAVEALAVRIVHATDRIPCENTSVRWDTGKDLEIKVTPRQEAELAGLGMDNERVYKVRVLPLWEFHPSLGLSLLAVPRARYAEYEALKEGDEQYRISRSGRTDSRFDYALTLGLVNRRLDWRRDRNVALWLPEITINPTEDVKLMALGAAASYRILKLGVGAAWMRHSVLAGQAVDDVIKSSEVPMRETYGKPKLYVSLSLIGLPPFLPN